MARFSIYSSDGSVVRYTGTPTYNGTYMKPSYLEFREIASDSPINWHVGDYVDYSRTGMRYKLYFVPQPTKNAKEGQSGKAYVYQNVQFFADTKKLEIALFRDLVPVDNQIHFSTQQAISVYDDVLGIAERLQACMDEFDPNHWQFEVAGVIEDNNTELTEAVVDGYDFGHHNAGDPDFNIDYLIETIQREESIVYEEKEFTMSGGTVLDALQQIYDTWEEVGWSHSVVGGVNVITLGKTLYYNSDMETNIFRYGKGMGLRLIKKTQANKDEMATRLYVYGSNRNMYPGYYRGKPILDASSVDIQNLMLPISTWGKTEDEGVEYPDAKKAYIQDSSAISEYGLIPKSMYFDGGDNEEIYPSIKKTTIGEVRAAITEIGQTEETYYSPSLSVYTDPDERVDVIKSAVNPDDDGTQTAGGSQYMDVESVAVIGEQASVSFVAGTDDDFASKSVSTSLKASYTMLDLPDSVLTIAEGAASGTLVVDIDVYASLTMVVEDGSKEICRKVLLTGANNSTFTFSSPEIKIQNVEEDSSISFHLELSARIRRMRPDLQGATLNLSSGTATYSFYHSLPPSFSLTIKQIGFSIGDRAALGDGKTIHMLDGKCAGRSFRVKKVLRQAATDDWFLQMYRGYDEDLSLYFPNNVYPISAGDHFVLLDIAMPEIYIAMASKRLLSKGLEMLSKTARIEPYYEPEIDAIQMVRNQEAHPSEEKYRLVEGKYFLLRDEVLTDNNVEPILIDTITISEGESAIPTYKISLREKKKVTFQQSTANTIKTLEQKVVDSSGTLKVVNTASTDYNDIDNKPSIDDVELIGNLDAEIDLGLARKNSVVTRSGTFANNYLLACDGTNGAAKAVNPSSISMGVAESIKDVTSQTGYKIAIVSSTDPMIDPNTIYIVI